MEKSVRIIVRGRVQGVWFRASTQKEAERLGVRGFAMNQSDGTVLIEAVGPVTEVDALIGWCHKGPMLARVDQVAVEEVACGPFEDFAVRR